MDQLSQSILDFWFGQEGSPAYGSSRPEWFKKDPAFDAEIHDKFGSDVAIAINGGHGAMIANQKTCLALIVMLDQFPRNMFRDTAAAFSGDKRALSVANEALRSGFDQNLPVTLQTFFYLPFEHSESVDDQLRCIDLFKAAGNDDMLKWAIAHHDIVARFGRFPHRNEILGRDSSAEEQAFLMEPNSSF